MHKQIQYENVIQTLYKKLNFLKVPSKVAGHKKQNNPILKSNLSSLFTKHIPYKYLKRSKQNTICIQKAQVNQSNYTFSNFGITTTKAYRQLKSQRYQNFDQSLVASFNKKNNRVHHQKLGFTTHQKYQPKKNGENNKLIKTNNFFERTITDLESCKFRGSSRKYSRSSCKSAYYRSGFTKQKMKDEIISKQDYQFNGWEVKQEEDDHTQV